MGTRNLTVVIYNGKHIIAQYGQFDGFINSAGLNIKRFITKVLNANFLYNLKKCKFISNKELQLLFDNNTQYQFIQKYPTLHRNTGCNILNILSNELFDEDILLSDNFSFGNDGLCCEYAYVIDLDNLNLEVYYGNSYHPVEYTRWKEKDAFDNFGVVGKIKDISFAELKKMSDKKFIHLFPSKYID